MAASHAAVKAPSFAHLSFVEAGLGQPGEVGGQREIAGAGELAKEGVEGVAAGLAGHG